MTGSLLISVNGILLVLIAVIVFSNVNLGEEGSVEQLETDTRAPIANSIAIDPVTTPTFQEGATIPQIENNEGTLVISLSLSNSNARRLVAYGNVVAFDVDQLEIVIEDNNIQETFELQENVFLCKLVKDNGLISCNEIPLEGLKPTDFVELSLVEDFFEGGRKLVSRIIIPN